MEAQPNPSPQANTFHCTAPVGDHAPRPVTVPPEASIGQALKQWSRTASAPSSSPTPKPPAVASSRCRICCGACAEELRLEQPISAVMTTDLVTLRPSRRLPGCAFHGAARPAPSAGVDQERRWSLVSQNDLFALQRVGIKEISQEIRDARDLASLQASRGHPPLVDTMMRRVGAERSPTSSPR